MLNESDDTLSSHKDDSAESEDELSCKPTKSLLVELLFVIATFFGLTLLVGEVGFIVPIIYILLDSAKRGRRRQDFGFKSGSFSSDIRKNADLIVLGVVIIQGLIISGGFLILPQYLEYVIAHRAWSVSGGVGVFAVMISSIPLTTMLEEVVFRGLTQERLSWFLGNGPAVIAATVLFALIHWAPGDPAILLIDMTAIAAGGMIYGVIYNRSRSIFAAWLAHMLSDFHGIVLLFLIFNFL